MQKIYNIIIILLITCSANAQVYQAYVNAADKAFEVKDFRTAMSYYGEAIDLDNEVDVDLLSKYAKSAQSYQSYAKAKTAYQQILEYDQDELNANAYFQLAALNISTGDYEQAKEFLQKYLENNDGNEIRKVHANKCLEDISWALNHDTKSIYTVEKLGDEVNTEFSEMSPVEYDGVLYYSSNNYFASSESIKPQSKIYHQMEAKSSRLASSLNDGDNHVGHYALNADKTITYFTKCNYNLGEINCKIYQADQDGNITALPQNINAEGTHSSQPNIGISPENGNEVLYFVSDRNSGQGGTDIYYAPIQNGVFKGPYALEQVNTTGNEVSPFYHAGSNKLYFSTDGRTSFGGLDIYAVSFDETWGEVYNLGSGVNTSYDDAYFSLNADGTQGYFASNRVESNYIDADLEACCYDIYKANLDVLEESILVQLFDQSNNQPLQGVSLDLSALPSVKNKVIYDASLSEYQLDIRTDLKYDLVVKKAGYELKESKVAADNDGPLTVFLKPITLDLNAMVIDEDKQKLGDYTYTISTSSDEGEKKKIDGVNKISETITKSTDYIIKVEKEGYYPETITLSQERLLKEDFVDIDIVLRKIPAAVIAKLTLDAYLPLPLFFDNDEPDQNSLSDNTTKNYHQTYVNYIQNKGEYLKQNAIGLSAEKKIDSDFKTNQFFDAKVKHGDESIEGFTRHLFNFLQEGSPAEILLTGYASPRFRTDYNDALTSRRVRSVENHFRQWNGGALVPFINSGQLKLKEKPVGESLAPDGISDELSDKQGSIYSVEASNERRVEILEIKSNVNPN